MNSEKIEQLTEIFKNNQEKIPEFVSLSPEEAVAVFKTYGLDVSVDEITALAKDIQKKIDSYRNGELSENDLENVSGGDLQGFANGMLVGYIILTCVAVAIPW